MQDLRPIVNEYLFHELVSDVELDASRISARWPFELREIGRLGDRVVLEFEHDQPYFVIAGETLSYVPKAGMTFDDLLLQEGGAAWIAERDPVDLSMSTPGDEVAPSSLDRRRALEQLGAETFPGRQLEILEGLFLRTDRRTLALFRELGAADATVVGLPSSAVVAVGFPNASGWRRLAWAVGYAMRTRASNGAESSEQAER